MMSVSHRVEPVSRLIVRSRSPTMSNSTIARTEPQRPVPLGRRHVVAAAVGVIVARPLDHRLLAVEEHKLDREGVLARLQHARQLEQHRGARPAVVGAHEAKVAKQLRVVVAGEDQALGRAPRDPRDHVRHREGADRRLRDELLLGGRQARGGQLRGDVAAGLGRAGRAGRPRTDGHQLPHVLESAARIERRRVGVQDGRC